LRLPPGWRSAGGPSSPLASATSSLSAGSFYAPQLLDAPILVGRLHTWTFTVDGTPHEVAYLPMGASVPFDTVRMITNIQNIVRAAKNIFGGFPYRDYSFLLEDSSAGALEHGACLTLGARGSEITSSGISEQLAHEFFHAWNGMSIQPSGYTPLNYGPQQLTTGLWFSEGVTMLYADLICRRTGLPVEDSTRLTHLTRLITRYYADTGNSILPPARVSLADYVQPGPLGDYSASTHLQGELLGACLDILIRHATDGHHSFDDVMREVFRRCGNKRPFTDSTIEDALATVCHCSEAHTFFRDHLYDGKPIDFNSYLNRLGLRMQHDQPPAADRQGHLLPDTRVYAWILRDDTSLRIGITNPNGCWAKAGLHTGDIITAVNGRPMHTRQDFQQVIRSLHVGDTVRVDVKKETGTITVPVYISSYTIPLIIISEDPGATPKQRRLLQQWVAGAAD
ncbi:MAG TPA: PDZ domain-containing protein, partial [Puia sp.]|nr:PDZ domain-containing protein [Puia sp.]